jgi:exonuclease III
VDFPSGDVTVVTIKGDWGKLTIFNIYIEGNSNNTISLLKQFHRSCLDVMGNLDELSAHTLWAGDFNRHHEFWDDHNDTHLFTTEANAAAEFLIEAVAALGLELALSSGIPTHCHNVTKKWTRLDQVFISNHSTDLIEFCDMETRFRSIKTDHLPMVTKLNLTAPIVEVTPSHNFHKVD